MAVAVGQGNVANLHVWLGSLGLQEWIFPTSLALLLALGLWSYRYRHVDIWILMCVTAYVARFWTYHRWYDDALILLPIVTLDGVKERLTLKRTKTRTFDNGNVLLCYEPVA